MISSVGQFEESHAAAFHQIELPLQMRLRAQRILVEPVENNKKESVIIASYYKMGFDVCLLRLCPAEIPTVCCTIFET